jgi:hypothetical protein
VGRSPESRPGAIANPICQRTKFMTGGRQIRRDIDKLFAFSQKRE